MTTNELIEALRACASPNDCGDCPYRECGCMNSMMSEAADAIESLTAPRWISVKERLPDETINPNTTDYEYVLCATTFGDVRAYQFGRGHFLHGFRTVDEYVTHWRPLPELPEVDK